jgi:hypothetical protein
MTSALCKARVLRRRILAAYDRALHSGTTAFHNLRRAGCADRGERGTQP